MLAFFTINFYEDFENKDINATCLAEGDMYVDACHNYIVSVEELS